MVSTTNVTSRSGREGKSISMGSPMGSIAHNGGMGSVGLGGKVRARRGVSGEGPERKGVARRDKKGRGWARRNKGVEVLRRAGQAGDV